MTILVRSPMPTRFPLIRTVPASFASGHCMPRGRPGPTCCLPAARKPLSAQGKQAKPCPPAAPFRPEGFHSGMEHGSRCLLKDSGGYAVRIKPVVSSSTRLLFAMFLALWALCAVPSAMSQADQGTITGSVTDNSGALLPRASVTLTSVGTNLSLKAETDASGVYIFTPVKIGDYRLVFSATGFETVKREDIHLDVQQRLRVDASLPPGAVTDTVTVRGLPPLMQTEDASVGQVLSEETLTQTPLNGRNWVYIAQLTAGVAPPEGTRGTGKGDLHA